MGVRFYIEKLPYGTKINWKTVAYPEGLEDGLKLLDQLKKEEETKEYKGKFRLLKVTTESIDSIRI